MPILHVKQNPMQTSFSTFLNFKWRWEDLALFLTEHPFLTLDSSALKDECTDPPPAVEDNFVRSNSTPIPLYQSAGSKLLHPQKLVRDELAKSTAGVFMVDDISMLENVQTKARDVHSELLKAASTWQAEELPIVK